MVIDTSKLCSPKRGVATTMSCTQWEDSSKTYDYITITDMFTEAREAGKTFEFYVSRLRNAISMTVVQIEVTTFESVQFTPDGEAIFSGVIDRGFAPLEA